MNRHERIFSVLEKVAEANEPATDNYRLVAALVHKNKIISVGWNQKKTHPFQKWYGKNEDALDLHAENAAVANALSNHYHPDFIKKCSLYVLRLRYKDRKDRTLVRAMAKPCKGCTRMISAFNIKKVFYTTDEENYDTL